MPSNSNYDSAKVEAGHNKYASMWEKCCCKYGIDWYFCRTAYKWNKHDREILSLSEERVLLAITAGTEQPNPSSIGTKLLPERPIYGEMYP